MQFFDETGPMAIGTRTRFLGEKIGSDAAQIYQAYGTGLAPKWFPVFYVLSRRQENTIKAIAEHIGHSHVSVSKIVTEMSKAGFVEEKTDPNDRRSTRISLSKKGKQAALKMEDQYIDVRAAVDEIASQATHNLWAAIAEWEYLLEQKPLVDRVTEKRKQRESQAVQIVPYAARHKEAFYRLNEEWISAHFEMEEPDRQALENPKKHILDQGGCIFVALLDNKPVGVCALKKHNPRSYELAKMAVSPAAQGKSIGFLLGKAAVEKARELGAERVFLESNTRLKPAIRLYEKLGFKKIVGQPSPYARCDIQMELKL